MISYLDKFLKHVAVFALLISKIFGIEIGFVDNGGTYTETFSEGTKGTIQLEVSDNDGTTVNFNFLIIIDYSTLGYISTAKRQETWNSTGYGNGYFRDFIPNNLTSWTSSDYDLTLPANFSVTMYNGNYPGYSDKLVYFCQLRATGNGFYDIQVPVIDDKMYEGGSGSLETIEFLLSDASSVSSECGATRFTYKINDNDLEPYYGFYNSSDQDFNEGTNLNDYGYQNALAIQPLANPIDGQIYVVGTNNFTFSWSPTAPSNVRVLLLKLWSL